MRKEQALEQRYERIHKQLQELLKKPGNQLSKMATVVALLHHKMPHYFWTGFYLLDQGRLIAGPYQGPVACQELEKGKGVCWASILQEKSLIVNNVDEFPGHIACSTQSKSEIVVPLRNKSGSIAGVLDVDSKSTDDFTKTDQKGLEMILDLLRETQA